MERCRGLNATLLELLDLDDRVTNTDYGIPMLTVDNALQLYNDIEGNYPVFLTQFYAAAVKIINRKYKNGFVEIEEDAELPF